MTSLVRGLARPAAILLLTCTACFADSARGEPSQRHAASAVSPSTVTPVSGPAASATSSPAPRWGRFSRSGLWAQWNALHGDAYALDDLERFLEKRSRRLTCDASGLVSYSGTIIRYAGAVRINEHFRPRLERFEAVVDEVAREIYGRAPRRVRHLGAYACRTSRNRSYRLSEHALGNAIDIVGFDFGPLPKNEKLDPALPKALRHPFQVRVARHWAEREHAPSSPAAVHTRFLRTLIDRLLERSDVFRGHVGPGHPGHDDHFHFDMSPWRFVRL